MTTAEVTDLLVSAVSAAERGETQIALPILEKAMRHDTSPVVCSYLAYCSAVERGDMVNAVMLCRQMIVDDPDNPVHYLNLGRVYRHHGRRQAALNAFRAGLKISPHEGLQRELEAMGIRKTPPVPWLHRDNPVNKYLGKARSRLQKKQPDALDAVPDPEEV